MFFLQENWQTLTNPEEAVDVFFKTDSILDFIWYIFSHSLGRCSALFINDGSNWLSRYEVNLIRDFFTPFVSRW